MAYRIMRDKIKLQDLKCYTKLGSSENLLDIVLVRAKSFLFFGKPSSLD